MYYNPNKTPLVIVAVLFMLLLLYSCGGFNAATAPYGF